MLMFLFYIKSCSRAFQIAKDPLTCTFKDRTLPNWGISTQSSTKCKTSAQIPNLSLPKIMHVLFGKVYDCKGIEFDVCSKATTVNPKLK